MARDLGIAVKSGLRPWVVLLSLLDKYYQLGEAHLYVWYSVELKFLLMQSWLIPRYSVLPRMHLTPPFPSYHQRPQFEALFNRFEAYFQREYLFGSKTTILGKSRSLRGWPYQFRARLR